MNKAEEIVQLNDKAIAVKVPEGATCIRISKPSGLYLDYDLGDKKEYDELPPGSWSILGRGSELTASDKASLVEKENDGSGHLRSWWYRDYLKADGFTKDIHDSFASLLKSLSLDPENSLILIKEEK